MIEIVAAVAIACLATICFPTPAHPTTAQEATAVVYDPEDAASHRVELAKMQEGPDAGRAPAWPGYARFAAAQKGGSAATGDGWREALGARRAGSPASSVGGVEKRDGGWSPLSST